jgi:hypothetical protein
MSEDLRSEHTNDDLLEQHEEVGISSQAQEHDIIGNSNTEHKPSIDTSNLFTKEDLERLGKIAVKRRRAGGSSKFGGQKRII